MFDKNWFYYSKKISEELYKLDFGGSLDLSITQKEYIIFHKRKFKKVSLNQIQNSMQILTKQIWKKAEFDERFFIHWLTYYQRQSSQAFLKWGSIEEMEVYQKLFNDFNLTLKFREYLEIRGDYSDLEEIDKDFENIDFNKAISFLLAIACVYGEWNLIEKQDDAFLWNILLKFPFDGRLSEYQHIITKLEDIFIKEWIYNNINFTKKQDFIINIKDNDMLKIFWELIFSTKLKDFFEIDEKIETFFDKQIQFLEKQLEQDLRIQETNFKLTEIKSVKLDF